MPTTLVAEMLDLGSWNQGDFKIRAKSKQTFAPIAVSGYPTASETEPLLYPWGVGKFQDIDSGRIALELFADSPITVKA